MALRTFRYYAIGANNTPQPVFGTKLTAAVSPDPNGAAVSIPVSDSSMIKVGDRVLLMNNFTTRTETVIASAVADGTHFSAVLTINHSNGDFAVLDKLCASVTVQGLDGSAGDYFFGTDPGFDDTLTAGNGKNLIFVARKSTAGQQPPFFNSYMIYGGNSKSTTEFWIQGTQNDIFLPSYDAV